MCFTFVEFMTQELTSQWLAEIKALKQHIAELQTEHDAGWQSAEKWRKLYNTEAEQRRTDAQMAQQTIASLKAQIQQIQGIEAAQLDDPTATTAIQQEVEQLESVEELKAKLIAVTKERDRLLQALKTEQDNHAQTRKSLTTALGDAIDGLTRERGSQ
jgi:vacuolar-type H+-ATPase subunit I/STV1